jgi:ribonuclease HI
MEGLDALQGVDRLATLGYLNSKPDPWEAGMLRGILSGSIRLQKRLCEAKLAESSVCQFCGMCDETVEHCFWDCTQWDHVRAQYDLPPASVSSQWPVCTKACGLFLESPCVLDLKIELEQEEAAIGDLPQFFDCHAACAAIQSAGELNEKQVIWTDGAASHNQDHRFRRAGSGIFYGEAHHMNLSVILPGLVQTNQRAELLAVLLSCLRDPRPLDIRSDSAYVCNGFFTWRSWYEKGWQHDHADLWNLLASHMCSRATCVQVSWVKGHAKPVDVLRGRTTEEDRLGNNGADSLAVAGARMHQVPAEVVDIAQERKQHARQLHRMMLQILKARLAAETQDHPGIDRGSEPGDVLEFVHDDVDDGDVVGGVHNVCTVFDTVAQAGSLDEVFEAEGWPSQVHEHDVNNNSLDDEIDSGP